MLRYPVKRGSVVMAMVCPQCKAPYEQRLQCPQCELRLVFEEGASGSAGSAPSWQQTPWGRIAIGLVLSQGIYHGLRHLCVAGLQATEALDEKELWATVPGLLLIQALQIVSLFLGAVLAGAGQRQGAIYGAVLGVWNGVLVVLIQPDQTLQMNTVSLYGLPLLQAAVGGLAGWVGSMIWRPLTPAKVPGASRHVVKVAKKNRSKLFVGPVAWMKVALGTVLAVCGALCAGVVLDKVTQISAYQLSPGSKLEAQVVTWEITSLAILLGAAFAGASRTNGLMQGLAVGVMTSVTLVGIRLAAPNPPSFFVLVFSMFGPVILGIMGGGFGSQLLPPIGASRRRSFETP